MTSGLVAQEVLNGTLSVLFADLKGIVSLPSDQGEELGQCDQLRAVFDRRCNERMRGIEVRVDVETGCHLDGADSKLAAGCHGVDGVWSFGW